MRNAKIRSVTKSIMLLIRMMLPTTKGFIPRKSVQNIVIYVPTMRNIPAAVISEDFQAKNLPKGKRFFAVA